MADEPTSSGWLPPAAPGGRPAPQFEPAPGDEPGPERAAPADGERDRDAAVAAWSTPADRPVFAPSRPGPARPSKPNGLATTSVVLGALGLLMVVFTLGAGFLFSLPFSIAAWLTGARGRRRVASGETDQGDGVAHAGVILGIVGVVLAVIGMIVWVALVASGLDLEQLRRELEEQSSS